VVTDDALFLPVNVNDERVGIRIRVNNYEGFNGLALQLVLLIVVGRIDVVSDLDVRIASCDPVVKVTFVTLLRLTQGLDNDRDLPAKAGHELSFAI